VRIEEQGSIVRDAQKGSHPVSGRKPKQDSRSAEFRGRLIAWKQTPESSRPSLRALARSFAFLSRDGCRRRPRPGEVLTPMPTKRKKGLARLTVQQLKLLEGLNAGLTITEAGRQAGYAQRQNSFTAYKNLKIRFHPALERAGYDADKILTRTAEKQFSKLEAKETKFFPHMGMVGEVREVEAHSIQLEAARDIQSWLIEREPDGTPPERSSSITIHIELTPAEIEESIRAGVKVLPAGTAGDMGQPVLDAPLDEHQR
jgi:hypothetical protein